MNNNNGKQVECFAGITTAALVFYDAASFFQGLATPGILIVGTGFPMKRFSRFQSPFEKNPYGRNRKLPGLGLSPKKKTLLIHATKIHYNFPLSHSLSPAFAISMRFSIS